MATFLLSFLIVLASLAALGIGLLLGRSAPAASCGGLSCGGCSKAGRAACRKHDQAAP